MNQGENKQSVRTRRNSEPFVRDSGVPGSHGVDRHELDVAALELADAHLDRVGIVVLGDAEHHEVARPLPVRFAEFPKGAANGVDARGGHVDGAEPSVSRVVRRTELHRPPGGKRLALVAPGEKGEAVRIGRSGARQPCRGEVERLVPLDLFELSGSAFADATQWLGQPGRRLQMHDPGRALGAEHTPVDRVVAVALDEAHLTALEVNLDAAAAGAHVACRELHFVGHACRRCARRGARPDLVRERLRQYRSCLGYPFSPNIMRTTRGARRARTPKPRRPALLRTGTRDRFPFGRGCCRVSR